MYQQLFSASNRFLQLVRIQLKTRNPLSTYSHLHSSRNTQTSNSKLGVVLKEVEEIQSLKLIEDGEEEEEHGHKQSRFPIEPKIEISHPWPEWVELMERLLKQGYFAGGGENGFHFFKGELGPKEANRIRTGCLNFARDRFDLIRYFSRKDIHAIVASGCPSLDRKVVNSGKRLRAHVGLDEGHVCSSCYLRGSCERAYVKAREDEGGRTVDVMRILLTYGLDPITGSLENESCLNRATKESVRRLLKEMVESSMREIDSIPLKLQSRRPQSKPNYSSQQQMLKAQIDVPMKQGDWVCPKCNFVNFARNIKCLRCDRFFQERLKKLGEDRDHLPLKKGDWICDKCNFLNFAKNTRCLQCKEKPPKRQLNPGEWECVSCNYINFRRNMVCLKCDWKRPKASNASDSFTQFQHEDKKPESSRITFVRNDDDGKNQHFPRSNRQSQEEDSDFWSDNDELSPHSELSDLEDFPIVGGRSVVSQDPRQREMWKERMSNRSKNISRDDDDDNDGDLGRANFPRSFNFGGSDDDDDDDMADWFGHRKKHF